MAGKGYNVGNTSAVADAFLLACLRMTWELFLVGAQPLLVAICLKSLDSESIIRFGHA